MNSKQSIPILFTAILITGGCCLPTNSINETYVSKVWRADNGDDTYHNPIIHADYSDPDVIRVGEDYYMVASSFSCFPGLPVLHSKDLVNWKLIGHALSRYEGERFDLPQYGEGVWAPCIRYHEGMFYIYWGDPDAGIYMVRSANITGPWSKPKLLLEEKGLIDPSPFWDDDGHAYLVHAWAASRCGVKSLLTVRWMNREGTEISEEGHHVFDGHERHHTIEGPKFYKYNGYYYIFAPAGGVKGGWQTVLRSKNIYGPYEDKIVMAQGSTKINGPHQGGWVQTPSGQSWFIHFQDKETYGRIVHLQPMSWVDGWPVIGTDPDKEGTGQPVLQWKKPDVGKTYPVTTPAESDEFNDGTLGVQWQWQASPQLVWSCLLPKTDYLRLFAIRLPDTDATLYHAPNLLCQKFPAPDFTATTKVTLVPEKIDCTAGLVILGDDYGALKIRYRDKQYRLEQVICKKANQGAKEQIFSEIPFSGSTAWLRVTITSPNADCQFSYSEDGKTFQSIGHSFYAQTARWIGAKVGLFCVSKPDSKIGGYADFDWFRID